MVLRSRARATSQPKRAKTKTAISPDSAAPWPNPVSATPLQRPGSSRKAGCTTHQPRGLCLKPCRRFTAFWLRASRLENPWKQSASACALPDSRPPEGNLAIRPQSVWEVFKPPARGVWGAAAPRPGDLGVWEPPKPPAKVFWWGGRPPTRRVWGAGPPTRGVWVPGAAPTTGVWWLDLGIEPRSGSWHVPAG